MQVELINPPADSVPGDRIVCEGFPGEPDAQLNPKKKVWEAVQPDLRTNDVGIAIFKGVPIEVISKANMEDRKGTCSAATLNNASIG